MLDSPLVHLDMPICLDRACLMNGSGTCLRAYICKEERVWEKLDDDDEEEEEMPEDSRCLVLL